MCNAIGVAHTNVTPADRAIALARNLLASGAQTAERAACVAALAAVPELRWSPDQLKARAFNPQCEGMFYSFGRVAR